MQGWKPALALLGVLTLALACTEDDPFDPADFQSPVPLATQLARISGDAQTGAAGETLAAPLVVRVLDQFGEPLEGVTVTWGVFEGGGSISATTSLTDERGDASVDWTLGDGLGVNEARATIGTPAGTVVFTATAVAGDPASIQVAPDTLRFEALGGTASATVAAQDARGHDIADPDVAWSSVDADVATVNQGGRVTAQDSGTTRVVASFAGAADTLVVVVTQAPALLLLEPDADTLIGVADTTRLRARVFDRNDRAIDGARAAWTTRDSAVAIVDSTGLVTATGEGTTTILAAFDSVSDSTAITVRVADAIAVSPEADTLQAVGDTTRLTAAVLDGAGDTIAAAPVTWSSADTAVATVDAYGRVTARALGSASIVAAHGALSDTAAIVVAPDTTAAPARPATARAAPRR